MPMLEKRYIEYRRRLEDCQQAHLLAFWPKLDLSQRKQLLDDLDQIDFERCQPLIEPYVLNKPRIKHPQRIEPPPILPADPDPEHAELYQQAEAAGCAAIRAGQVAAFTVAGGQGTRLGYDGPKGAFQISPVRAAPLFQLFAEALLGVERRYGFRPRWYIMTSPSNHADTVAFFTAQSFFGLSAEDVMFFPQGQMPAFMPDGRIALAQRHRIALSPDGHGGSLRALAESGALADMRARGVEHISYFQVDNPLVKVIDPLFIGLHIIRSSDMSTKVATKADDTERVGNFCLADGQLTIIEYSDLPEDLAHAKNPDGTRRFNAGNLAIHIIKRSFVERLTAAEATVRLPWHRAEKKVAVVESGDIAAEPVPVEVVKLEMFVFDAIQLAQNPLVLYTKREEEFSPVKNASGVDSAETAQRDLIRRAARWLEQCGCLVPRDATGEPNIQVEISPAFALDEADLRERLQKPPKLLPKQALILA